MLDSLVHYDSAIASLSIALGTDASGFDPDGPLPRNPRDQRQQERPRARRRRWPQRDNLTVRQLAAARSAAMAGSPFVGTPATIADEMEEWLDDRGLRRLQHHVPVPARRARRFRRQGRAGTAAARHFPREYEGPTLRENLGLPRPKNRFFEG